MLVMEYLCQQAGCEEFGVRKVVEHQIGEAKLYFAVEPLCGGCLAPPTRVKVDRGAEEGA